MLTWHINANSFDPCVSIASAPSSSQCCVYLRQRNIQYELIEARHPPGGSRWDDIREVANPNTGIFAPVSLALRHGWIRLCEGQNLYVNTTTGTAIPLETALSQGRIRLGWPSATPSDPAASGTPQLLLAERVFHGWRRALIGYMLDTQTGDLVSSTVAFARGLLDISGRYIRVLDTQTGTWISLEEAVGKQILSVEPCPRQLIGLASSARGGESDDGSEDSLEGRVEEAESCRVFRISHIRPGGESGDWLEPLQAQQLGLFQWQTGDVAADLLARPFNLTNQQRATGIPPNSKKLGPESFVPISWISLLSARQSGWIRLREESEPYRWLPTSSRNPEPFQATEVHTASSQRLAILANEVSLVAPTSTATLSGPLPPGAGQQYHISQTQHPLNPPGSPKRTNSSPEFCRLTGQSVGIRARDPFSIHFPPPQISPVQHQIPGPISPVGHLSGNLSSLSARRAQAAHSSYQP
ncbi:unnamed protein product, partial [Protopolystoma xenopodis]